MPVKGQIGGNSNITPRLIRGGFPRVRILRPRDPMVRTTLQPAPAPRFGTGISQSRNVFKQGGFPVIRGRAAVRRLFVRDPYNLLSTGGITATGATQATFSPVADQFTNNNTYKGYHPEKAPGAVRTVRVGQPQPGTRNRGKEFTPNRITMFGGKTLRRR